MRVSSGYNEPLIIRGGQNRTHRPRAIQEIELSSRQSYQPPHEQHTPRVVPGRVVPIHGQYRQSQQRSSQSTSTAALASFPPPHHHHHHQQQQHYSTAALRHDNPATNLSWSILSHGLCCVQCVRTQEVGIVERFGAFQEVIGPGLYCGGIWPCTVIKARLSLRVQQIDVTVETKTSDNVFVYLEISVQYRVWVERAYDAYYRLTDASVQIRTHVYDVIRSTVPRMDLNQVFATKTEIADTVFTKLQSVMKDFGFEIVSTLVAKVTPNQRVKDSMNEMNASKRMKESMPHKAEAEKISKVKEAEAHAEKLYLTGIGIAKERGAIIDGLKSGVVESFKDPSMPAISTREIMDLLLVSQYLDTLVAVGAKDMLLRSAPSEIIDMQRGLPQPEPMVPRDLLWE